MTHYFSKWRHEWVEFLQTPGTAEIAHYKKYYYQLKDTNNPTINTLQNTPPTINPPQ